MIEEIKFINLVLILFSILFRYFAERSNERTLAIVINDEPLEKGQ